uniref:Glutathione s-transferase theta-1-like protein n=1 Tax=Pseudodiaptomus poplesia TaxID=213370 RepID=A0A1S6GL52_9MAXI|nr:glutathione s-transferase theta-1-like protein [Pseudodiaptomus poplesia]
MAMRLFGNRVSHPVRACILLARKVGQPLEEVNVDILKGEQFKIKDLPFRKIPVLKHGDLTLAESTAILRYIADSSPSGGDWYPKDLKKRAKVDEFLDHWHSTFNPTIFNLMRNKLFYKMLFRADKPDEKVIAELRKAKDSNNKLFNSYFIKGKPFVAGEAPSIADILATVTMDQTSLIGEDLSPVTAYMDRVKSHLEGYDELHKVAMEMPVTLRKMKMIS